MENVFCVEGSPKAALGREPPSASVTATFPTPCEIDVDFGSVGTGLTSQVWIAVENIGDAPLDLDGLAPDLNPEFWLSYSNPDLIPPGTSYQFPIAFEPLVTGLVSSSISIQTDGHNPQCPDMADGGFTGVTVALTGTGTAL